MKDLSRHIEYLLLDHDCVIIPQLGAFVARHLGSELSQDENLFIPPCRLVHFNSQLIHDDQVLSQSLANTYHVDAEEASMWCQEFVTLIHEELLVNGTYDFGTIGILYKENEFSPIAFSSCKAGVTTPELYGLDTFQLPLLTEAERASVLLSQEEARASLVPTIENEDKHITIRLNKRMLEYVAAIAASIIVFFAYSTPSGSLDTDAGFTSNTEFFIPHNLIPQGGMPTVQPLVIDEADLGTLNEAPAVEEIPTEEATEVKSEIAAPATAPAPQPVEEEKNSLGKYAIVLSSAVSNANAENYVNSLNKMGYKAQVYNNGKLNRVVIAGFQSEEEARSKMRAMKDADAQFKDAWLMTL